jgi:PilZ domain
VELVVQDKRSHPRITVDTQVTCELRDTSFVGLAKDISIGGMFVESSEVVPFNTEISIVGRFPGAKADLRLAGLVRWTKKNGFGIQFGSLGARETHAISELLERELR